MAVTTKVPLGASTLNRKWYLDVNTGTYGAPVWTGVFGVTDLKPVKAPTMQDDADYDSEGWKSESVTALAWALELKIGRKVTAAAATAYDPGQEALRAASDEMGIDNRVDVRWYEYTGAAGGPEIEAYRGFASVSWEPEGGPMDANDMVSVKLTGQGARTPITHPAGAAVPVLYSVDPATAGTAGGSLHVLTGTGFMLAGVDDVVSVTIGVTDVPTFSVLNDNELVWLSPAKVAGPFVVYVENSVGESVTATVTVTYA